MQDNEQEVQVSQVLPAEISIRKMRKLSRRGVIRVLMVLSLCAIFFSPALTKQAKALETGSPGTPEMPAVLVPVFLLVAGGAVYYVRKQAIASQSV